MLVLTLFVLVFAFGSLTMAIAATTAAMSSVARSRASLLMKFLVIFGAIAAFAYTWGKIGPINEKRFELFLTISLKTSLSLMSSVIVLVAAALCLRIAVFITARVRLASPHELIVMFGSAVAGVAIGFGALNGIENTWIWATEEDAPILLSITGEPTHCVWRDTSIRDQHSRQSSSVEYIHLKRGQRIRLDPDILLDRDTFTVRFAVQQGANRKVYYGQSTDFRRLDNNVDPDCQW